MRDLQHRLFALGYDTASDDAATFGRATAAAVHAFRTARGLGAQPVCDAATWEALVEAGWRLGDRLLYRTQPFQRGDDVSDLQRRLGAIGFDAGRIDGIFGPRTERALTDFQRNAGVVCDANCGPETITALARLGDRNVSKHSVADVRERERLRQGPKSLAGRVIALAHGGGLDALATRVAKALAGAGADAIVLQHPDGSEQAAQANAVEADVFLALAIGKGSTCRVAYYRDPGGGWESPGGRLLAELLSAAAVEVLGCAAGATTGMSVPVLRETRMPAALVELAPAAMVVERTSELALVIPAVLDAWIGHAHEV